jgi:hypothetical protein
MNESIESVVRNLSVQPDDRILTICSCAQPFGLLENIETGSILAIDNNPEQIKFAKKVMRLIKRGDKQALKEMDLTPKDGNYLLEEQRFRKIGLHANRLKYAVMDVYDSPSLDKDFTKGYFSNTTVDLVKYHQFFQKGALIYVTYATSLLPNDIPLFIKQREASWKCRLSDFYEIDAQRTRSACEIEQARKVGYHKDNNGHNDFSDWTPCVFIKK